MASRRAFLKKSGQMAGALAAATTAVDMLGEASQPTPAKKQKFLMRSSWGTDDPTRASFVFDHALALAEAGHEVQIFLTADATYLMRKATVDAVKPIGWPPLSETMEKIVAKRVPVFS